MPRLDNPDQAVRPAGDSATDVDLPHSPLRASTPIPAPLPRTSVPSASRRRHRSCAQERPLGEGLGSEEESHSLRVLSIGLQCRPGKPVHRGIRASWADIGSIFDFRGRVLDGRHFEDESSRTGRFRCPEDYQRRRERRRRERIERGVLIGLDVSIAVNDAYRFPFSG